MEQITTYVRTHGVVIGRWTRVLACLGFLFGIYMLFSYSMPMKTENFETASHSFAGDKATALYDRGLQLYKAEEYKRSLLVLQDAYNACQGSQGVVDPEKRKLAADIKFLTGNALVESKQLQQAVEAYKEALRLDPSNLYAKYNLELLQSMNGGKGPGDGDPNQPGGGQPGKGIKKGI